MYKFYNPTLGSCLRRARLREEIKFGGEGNIRSVVFEEYLVIDDR